MPAIDFLRGIRVVDVSQFIPGPQAALHLCDLGAEVVKVEPPGGEPMRTFPPLDPDGVGAPYKLMNRGKTVVELDLKTDAGKRAFADLIAAADVLVESYRPGVLDRLGFDRKTLERLNPGLVHVALTGFGQTGPYRTRAGHDINYMALAGGLAASGTEERPVAAYPPTADHASALQAALAAAAALFRRRESGRGAFIDVSLGDRARLAGDPDDARRQGWAGAASRCANLERRRRPLSRLRHERRQIHHARRRRAEVLGGLLPRGRPRGVGRAL